MKADAVEFWAFIKKLNRLTSTTIQNQIVGTETTVAEDDELLKLYLLKELYFD